MSAEPRPESATDAKPGIGQRLRWLRKRRGLSLRALAREAGCSEGHVSKIENDKASASIAVLHGLAAALDTNLAYLFESERRQGVVVSRASAPPLVRETSDCDYATMA